MGKPDDPDRQAAPLPDAVRTVIVEAFARALLRDLRAAGVLPEPTTGLHETEPNLREELEVNVEQK